MGERKYRTYTEEFKQEALGMLKRGGKSALQIERELGITAGMLLKWENRYQVVTSEKKETRLELGDLEMAQQRIHRLEGELTEAIEEREILKKVVSIFSRKSA